MTTMFSEIFEEAERRAICGRGLATVEGGRFKCGLPSGHVSAHEDSENGMTWEFKMDWKERALAAEEELKLARELLARDPSQEIGRLTAERNVAIVAREQAFAATRAQDALATMNGDRLRIAVDALVELKRQSQMYGWGAIGAIAGDALRAVERLGASDGEL